MNITIEDRLERLEEMMWDIKLSLAKTDEEVDVINLARKELAERDWENDMGEDL